MTAERRHHARKPVELQVAYEQRNAFFADYTKNISKGGTFIRSRRSLPIGTVFRFRLVVPGRADPFELEGVVVRNQAEGDEPGVGIQFRWGDEETRRAFERAVESMMTESFGPEVARQILDGVERGGH